MNFLKKLNIVVSAVLAATLIFTAGGFLALDAWAGDAQAATTDYLTDGEEETYRLFYTECITSRGYDSDWNLTDGEVDYCITQAHASMSQSDKPNLQNPHIVEHQEAVVQ